MATRQIARKATETKRTKTRNSGNTKSTEQRPLQSDREQKETVEYIQTVEHLDD